MKKNGWDDSNIPVNAAFISICCTPDIKKNYLEELKHKNDDHWFKHNHSNVLNVEFDDITESSIETYYGIAYGITDEIAQKIAKFIKDNHDKEIIYVHCMAGKSRSIAVGKLISEYCNCRLSCYFGIDNLNEFVYNKIRKYL